MVSVTASDDSVRESRHTCNGNCWNRSFGQEYVRACSSPSHIPGLGKELKLTKKSIKTEVRGTIKCHYEKNSIVVICWNYNGPVTVISNVHADFLLTTVKRLHYSSTNHIKINRPYCITKYNKYMGRVDYLDALVSVYQIDVPDKKWYWPHYINTVDVHKSAAFKVFKLVNPDAKTNF